jgi:hypothetical protein
MTEFFDDLNKRSDEELTAIANGKFPFFLSAKSTTTREDVMAEAKTILQQRENKEKSWHEKPWGKIVIAVVSGIILILIGLVINFYTGPYLQKNQSQDKSKSPTIRPENKPDSGVSLPQTQPKALILQPAIVCILDKHPTDEHFLIFTIKNEGSAPAKLVSVDHVTMGYYWKEQKIKTITYGSPGMKKFEYNEPGRKWLFTRELGPNKTLSGVTGHSVWPDESMCVNILYFHTTFLTSEMTSKEKTCTYFVEGRRIYARAEYRTHKQFSLIDREIQKTLKDNVANFHMPSEYKRQ